MVNQINDNGIYTIVYPIETSTCLICDDNIGLLNLKIRQHIMDNHGLGLFNYQCKLCNKLYDSINSIKSHHTACKRQNNTLTTHDSAIAVHDDNGRNEDTQTPTHVDPLECVECQMKQIIFKAKDMKSLITHMRTKHAAAYETSKKVATKRLAWSTDEDRVLAELEVSLKGAQKGQILSRLHTEYNRQAAKSNAPKRSKEAIRGRRQQIEYKNVLVTLQSSQHSNSNDTSDDDQPSTVNISTQQMNVVLATNILDNENSLMKIREFLQSNIHNSTRCTTSMNIAVDAFINLDGGIDLLQLSMQGIQEALKAFRDRSQKNNQQARSQITDNKKPIRNAKRYQKSRQYGYYQYLYYRNKKKLVAELLDGESSNINPPPINIAEDYYKGIWSKTVTDNASFDEKKMANGEILFAPITIEEIQVAIKNTKKDSAAGPDHVNLGEVKGLSDELLAAFNIWLGIQKIPKELKENKTTLIPKGNVNLNSIKNWRPITVSSMILRIYNKILGYRMNRVFKTSEQQVGFKPVNGCGINITWLHSLLKHARLNKNTIYACLIDVSKAFDSVSHQSIIRALKRNGAPLPFVELIMDQYTGASTTITYENTKSQKIDILCGVKQGDPLSSILFNLVIDELFDILGDNYGYSIQGIGQTNARCFADDLGLVSSSRMGMGELLVKTSSFLEARGLAVNPAKCVSIGIAKGYKGKKSKIETEPLFSLNGVLIPMLGYTDNTTRYLGIKFTSVGAIDSKQIKVQINDTLNKIVNVKLKAQCKVDLLRMYIIPRFIFQLINTELYPTFLSRIDISIRKILRQILHLPLSLSNEFFYLPIKEGGLQFPVLREAVGLAKIKLFKKIIHLHDPLLQHLVETQGGHVNQHFLQDLQIGGSCTAEDLETSKDRFIKNKRASYAKKVHSAGQEIFATCPLTNRWLQGDIKTMKTRIFINSIKLRTNTLETRVTTTRGLHVDKTCRRCKLANESLMHVLQCCPSTKGLRYTRHHRICARVANKLVQNGYTVYKEKSFPDPNNTGRTLRPDMVAIKDTGALVLDVSAIYETSGATFINAYQRKVDKYKPITSNIKDKFNCEHVELHGLIIGSRGSYYHNQLHIWHQMGFSSQELKFIAIGCMEDSIKVASTFGKGVLQ